MLALFCRAVCNTEEYDMTRIVEQNGKLVLKSFSYFGPGGKAEADAELRRVLDQIEEHNRKSCAIGDSDGHD